ncbi:hypothetical protein [Paenibacillus endoradicis]|uniref:hypothetical protein n=1 Tax=Paenibacillus endoradicis TaxID=2972487 RepID=UPI002158C4D0|nr:hypothetical protein [Paenibacillus endoradicis]MCR8659465.1 hypothetical protein [Paenibacillus endoradicis]
MKRILTVLMLMVTLLVAASCSSTTERPFMIWMDSYIAVDVNTQQIISTSLYSKQKLSFTPEDIINVQFIGGNNKIVIDQYEITENKDKSTSYYRYDLLLTYKAIEIGKFETIGIKITTTTLPIMSFPIGTWHFDVNETAANVIESWTSVAATSNNVMLPYNYTLVNEAILLTTIQYSKHDSIHDANGLPLEDKIDISKQYESPIVYVRTKINSVVDERNVIDYGNGIYLQSPLSLKEIVEISRTHNQVE